jgi:hypothetical protein
MRALKVLIVILGVLLLLLTGLRVWCLSYKCTDPKLAEQVEQETLSRLKRQDRESEDQQNNSWSDARAVFNIVGTLPDPVAYEEASALKEWSPMLPKSRPLKDSLDSPEFKKALAGYLKSQAMLKPIFAKPEFIWPSQWEKGFEAGTPVYSTFRDLFAAGITYSEYLKIKGKPGPALELLLNYLEWTDKLDRQGYVTTGLYSIKLKEFVLQAIQVLLLEPSLTSTQLKSALLRISKISSPMENFRNHADAEYVGQMQSLRLIAKGQMLVGFQMNPTFYQVASWFGYLDREQKTLQNWMLIQRPAVQSDQLMGEIGQPCSKALQTLLSESRSTVLELVAFNTSTAQANALKSCSLLGATELECALALYRKEHKAYPDKLEALSPQYLKELPPNKIGTSTKFDYRKEGTGFRIDCKPRPAIANELPHSNFSIPPDRSNP